MESINILKEVGIGFWIWKKKTKIKLKALIIAKKGWNLYLEKVQNYLKHQNQNLKN